MSFQHHIVVAPGTTFCPDTPDNWKHFNRLKDAILNHRSKPHKPTSGEQLNKELQKQISRENKALRGLRRFLPGYEPDRYVY